MTQLNKPNQRNHYRITDVLRIGLQFVPPEFEKDIIEEVTQGISHTSLERLNGELDQAIRAIPSTHKDISRALMVMNRKLDLLASTIGLNATGSMREVAINLSFGGCRLLAEQEFNKDDGVDVSILLAGNQRLRLFARVVDVKALTGSRSGEYELALQFQAMGKRTALILEKHIVQRQRLALRTRLRR